MAQRELHDLVHECIEKVIDIILFSRGSCLPLNGIGAYGNLKDYLKAITIKWKSSLDIETDPIKIDILSENRDGSNEFVLMERWCFSYNKNDRAASREGRLSSISRRLSVLQRTLYCFVRMLPLFEVVNTRNRSPAIKFHVNDVGQKDSSFSFQGVKSTILYAFPKIQTPYGKIGLDVEYRHIIDNSKSTTISQAHYVTDVTRSDSGTSSVGSANETSTNLLHQRRDNYVAYGPSASDNHRSSSSSNSYNNSIKRGNNATIGGGAQTKVITGATTNTYVTKGISTPVPIPMARHQYPRTVSNSPSSIDSEYAPGPFGLALVDDTTSGSSVPYLGTLASGSNTSGITRKGMDSNRTSNSTQMKACSLPNYFELAKASSIKSLTNAGTSVGEESTSGGIVPIGGMNQLQGSSDLSMTLVAYTGMGFGSDSSDPYNINVTGSTGAVRMPSFMGEGRSPPVTSSFQPFGMPTPAPLFPLPDPSLLMGTSTDHLQPDVLSVAAAALMSGNNETATASAAVLSSSPFALTTLGSSNLGSNGSPLTGPSPPFRPCSATLLSTSPFSLGGAVPYYGTPPSTGGPLAATSSSTTSLSLMNSLTTVSVRRVYEQLMKQPSKEREEFFRKSPPFAVKLILSDLPNNSPFDQFQNSPLKERDLTNQSFHRDAEPIDHLNFAFPPCDDNDVEVEVDPFLYDDLPFGLLSYPDNNIGTTDTIGVSSLNLSDLLSAGLDLSLDDMKLFQSLCDSCCCAVNQQTSPWTIEDIYAQLTDLQNFQTTFGIQ